MLHGNGSIIKHKVGLLSLAGELWQCFQSMPNYETFGKHFLARQLRGKKGGVDPLTDKIHKKPNLKNREDEQRECAVENQLMVKPGPASA